MRRLAAVLTVLMLLATTACARGYSYRESAWLRQRMAIRQTFNRDSLITTLRLRMMHQSEPMVFISPAAVPHTLHDAAARAQRIVLGTATRTWFGGFDFAFVTVAVDHVVKGDRISSVRLTESGGPEPMYGGGLFFGRGPFAPVLLPGDRVIALLHYYADLRSYGLVPFGLFFVQDGRVTDQTAFTWPELVGRTEDEAIGVLRTAMQETVAAPPP